jgi:hypothetical protein
VERRAISNYRWMIGAERTSVGEHLNPSRKNAVQSSIASLRLITGYGAVPKRWSRTRRRKLSSSLRGRRVSNKQVREARQLVSRASMCYAGGVNNYGFHDDRPIPLSASCATTV